MDVVLLLRALFILMASTMGFASGFPSLHRRFFLYGPRSAKPTSPEDDAHRRRNAATTPGHPQGRVEPSFLDAASRLQVPHRWFWHFYALSAACGLLWLFQIVTKGALFRSVASHRQDTNSTTMTVQQVLLIETMLLAHACRRFYESVIFSGSSTSTMWIVHWLAGLTFYALMSVAVWIEGIPALASNQTSISKLITFLPSLRSLVFIPVFLIASGIQHDCHNYLASLKKYSLPTHPIFQLLICPHYFAESLIYLSMATVAAPKGLMMNWTLVCALVFVVVNLAITASNTRVWYETNFGKESIEGRWNMFPLIW